MSYLFSLAPPSHLLPFLPPSLPLPILQFICPHVGEKNLSEELLHRHFGYDNKPPTMQGGAHPWVKPQCHQIHGSTCPVIQDNGHQW